MIQQPWRTTGLVTVWQQGVGAIDPPNEDYRDMEDFILQWTPAGTSIGLLRPHFPPWRKRLQESGVDRVSFFVALGSSLMDLLIKQASSKSEQNPREMHNLRNLLWALGVPMLRKRGWKI